MDTSHPRPALSEAQRDDAFQRYRELLPYLQGETTLKGLAATLGVHRITLQRRVAAYEADGLVGLAQRIRSDKGTRDIRVELVLLAEGLAVQKPLRPITTIHRIVSRVAEQQGWAMPGYHTLYKLLHAMDPGMVMLAIKGSKAYREAFDLLYRFSATAPNEIWQADHSPLPVRVRDAQGRSFTPWLTIIEDDYSRAIPGYALNVSAPSSLQTALALRHAIWRKDDPRWRVCGIPGSFYSDHGSDFTSLHMEQVAAELKIQVMFSEIGFPRGRGKIERFFRALEEQCLADLPGYSPKGQPKIEAVLTLSELDAAIREFLLGTYHQQTHSETDAKPQARWEGHGFLPNMPPSLEDLDILMLTFRKTRKVMGDGIQAFGQRYLHLNLAAYVGEDVLVRYDPSDMAEIRVYHAGKFLCRAIDQELAGQRISLKDIQHARRQRRQELQSGLKTRAQIIDKYVAIHHSVPEIALPPPSPEKPRLKRYENE